MAAALAMLAADIKVGGIVITSTAILIVFFVARGIYASYVNNKRNGR